MAGKLKEKISKLKVGKSIKETASAFVSDVKEITKNTKNAAGDAFDHVKKDAKDVIHKAEKLIR